MGFIALIMGITFLVSVANQSKPLTDVLTQTNESFSGVLNQNVTLQNGNITTVSAVRNSTGAIDADNYSVNTTMGYIILYAPQVNGTFYIDYSYYSSNYVQDTGARTMTSLIVVFFALAVLGVLIAVMWPSIRDKFDL